MKNNYKNLYVALRKQTNFQRLFVLLFSFILLDMDVWAQVSNQTPKNVPADSTIQKSDTLKPDIKKPIIKPRENRLNKPYKPSTRPIYNFEDRYADPLSAPVVQSPLLLSNPSTDFKVNVDSSLNYSVQEKLGEFNFRPPSSLNFEDFDAHKNNAIIQDYLRQRSLGEAGEGGVSSRRLIPPIFLSPKFDRIFGGSRVDIIPTGFVTLDFGARFQRIFNNTLPIRRQRSNTPLVFNQQISLNVQGSIGDKLKISTNFDNNNSFSFDNNFKVGYTGYPEDIIKSIEVGNVSMPLDNSLISGSSNLFGLKTQLQFGKLFVTMVASTQRGKSESLTISGSGGGKAEEFEIKGSEYDENRHFFLGHFFRNNYENWLSNLPNVNSQVVINKVEVYVVNRSNNTQNLRNFASFMDLGETDRAYRKDVLGLGSEPQSLPTHNDNNNLYSRLKGDPAIRNADETLGKLQGELGLVNGTDFVVINSARKLDAKEFSVNEKLGYINLFRKLQNDESLAVSYSYSYRGQRFQVGELSEDYGQRTDDDVIFLKMLRPGKNNIKDQEGKIIPTWDLMMKNVYTLNSGQVSKTNFKLQMIYRDDATGVDNPSLHEGENTKDIPLVRLFGLDRLNLNGDPQPDGNFDYVEGVTIEPDQGTIFFPVLEPLGTTLESLFEGDTNGPSLTGKYVFDALYASTKADAERIALKNKFYITGTLQSGSSSSIRLPGINVAEGSVKVTAGNTPLTEGVDYTVDYSFGTVNIINEGVLNSGRDINVSYEKADLFSFQSKTLVGARFDYKYSDRINIGATILHLNERPLVTRIGIGDEPVRNTKIGFDFNYQKESRMLTKMVDAIPLISTKEPSSVTFNGEFAKLFPGTSNKVRGDGTVYIDDFEASATPFSLGGSAQSWKLSSVPYTSDFRFDPSRGANKDLSSGYKRAKTSWFLVDNIFYRSAGLNLPDIDNQITQNDHYTRNVFPREVFTQQSLQVGNNFLPIFNIVYYPSERGAYNYNPEIANNDGLLPNPKENFGGIVRAVRTEVDFDKSNIEFMEFWLMDPFIEGQNGIVKDGIFNQNNTTGGEIVFNLGSVSEDLIRDNRHNFENGLPPDGSDVSVETNELGRVTTDQFVVNAFDNNTASRANQDVGLEGLSSEKEATFDSFSNFVNAVRNAPINQERKQQILNDVSGDDFQYYLGDAQDAAQKGILERYKYFNGMENNSPVVQGNQNIVPSGSNLPDNEDLNRDQTISNLEEYFEYRIPLTKGGLQVGKNHIVDRVTSNIAGDDVNWYLFRVPVREPTGKQGNISDFKSIRYVRTYLTGWEQPVVMRMAKFQLVGSQWIRYQEDLFEKGFFEPVESSETSFIVSVVNIEENSQGGADRIPYVLPPGFIRDFDNTSTIERQLNEQSLKLTINDLNDRDARAVYKNVNLDLINYGKLQMLFHADSRTAETNDLTGFIRLGNDFDQNYYEVEIPLEITPIGSTSERAIWPEANEIDFKLENFLSLKKERSVLKVGNDLPFKRQFGKYTATVRGKPELTDVKTIMIGVRNPSGGADQSKKSISVWANELRVADFDKRAGWAANARLNMKLADFADVTASTRYTSVGFGGIQQKIYQRSREETLSYDIAANVKLDKFIPEKAGVQLPMYVAYEKQTKTPFYDPISPDIPLTASLAILEGEEKKAYKDLVTDQSTRRSINFTNVKKIKVNPESKNHFYDISNLSFTYSWSEQNQSNFKTQQYLNTTQLGAVDYSYAPEEGYIEPFKNAKAFSGKYLQFVKDFNLGFKPNSIGVRAELNRRFTKTQNRNANLGIEGIEANYQKLFTFTRSYNFRWNLTRKLSFDYNADVYAIVDEPDGEIDTTEERDEIIENIKKLGRMKTYNHNYTLSYSLPFDKFPVTSFIKSEANYSGGYRWQAGALDQIEEFGNSIQNNREMRINGKFDLLGLYNKSKLLKGINTPLRKKRKSPQKEKEKKANNKEESEENKKQKEKKKKRSSTDQITGPGRGFLRLLMSLRSVDFNYTVTEQTTLPGFKPNAYASGFDRSFDAPGLAFLAGSQDPEIRELAVRKGWLVKNPLLSTTFGQGRKVNININAVVEPIRDFRITLKAKKSKDNIYSEVFRATDDNINEFASYNPSRSGSYNVSIITLRTAFDKLDNANNTDTFLKFQENRATIQRRLESTNTGSGRYDINSQDVLIPAFLSAYMGESVDNIPLSPFKRIPLPNWTISYSGLSKIPAIRKKFRSISINHGYNASFDIRSFNSSTFYTEKISLDNNLETYRPSTIVNPNSETGNYVPVYALNVVTITESFSPLVGLSISTKKRMTINIDYKKERSLNLNLSNSQVSEVRRRDIALTFGLTKKGMKLPFRRQGQVVTLKNDLSLKMQMSVGDNITLQRKFELIDDPSGSGQIEIVKNTPTQGNFQFQLRPTIDYVLNDKLNFQFYFERSVNNPIVQSSFKRTTTAFGFRLRFNLAQ